MDRHDTYFRQLLTEAQLDELLNDAEVAMWRLMVDNGLYGVVGSGLTVAESSPTGLSMDVAAGTAYDQSGRRIRVPSTQTVDLSVDYLDADTAVATVGNAKYLSIYVLFDRDPSNPKPDGNGDVIYYDTPEHYRFKVVQGTEGVGPSKPALLSDGILLADILLTYGDTAVVNADRDTTRRMNLLRSTGSPLEINATSILSAFAQVLAVVNPHIGGSGQRHGADDIDYGGSPTFADGSTQIPNSGTVEDAIDWIATNLGKKTATSGDDLIGCLEDSSVSPTLIAATLRERLVALRLAANLTYAGSGNWANGASIPAGTIEATIDTIVSTLASTSGSGGALRVGSGAVSQSPTSLTAKSIYEQITDLVTAINARARIGSAETITGAWTFADFTLTLTNKVKYASRSLVRAQTGLLVNTNGTIGVDYVSVAATEAAKQKFDRLPDGATLTAVTVYHNRTDGGVLPTNKVKATLWKHDVTTGSDTSIAGPTTDPATPVGTYEAYHGLSLSGLSEVIDNTKYIYYVTFEGETGSDTQSTLFNGCTATLTVTNQDEAP